MRLLENDADLVADVHGGLTLVHAQAITSDFVDSLKSERAAKADVLAGEYDRVASVPTFVWDLWIRQGRDPFNATPKQIVAWLTADSLDSFVTTPRRQ